MMAAIPLLLIIIKHVHRHNEVSIENNSKYMLNSAYYHILYTHAKT